MVDYTGEEHAKQQKMQEVLADLRKQSETVAVSQPVCAASPPSQVATSETPVAAPSALLVPPGSIRLAVGHDALAIEELDRAYGPARRTVCKHLSPGSNTSLFLYPSDGKLAMRPKAWSFRVHDTGDTACRRVAKIMDVSINAVLQLQIDRRLGLDTDELEADYYRIALESGKEATLVARDISGFGVYTHYVPMLVVLHNPNPRYPIDILIRVWGDEGSTTP